MAEGTSIASPMAAGVAALLLQKNPGFTPAQVKHALESTAIDKGNSGYDNTYGWGLINAGTSVNSKTTLGSYSDAAHTTTCSIFDFGNTVYFNGTGYLPNYTYSVNYFDGSDLNAGSDDIIADASGSIYCQYHLRGYTGTWHVIVSEPQFEPHYLNWGYSIAVDSFTLIDSAHHCTLTIAAKRQW